MSKDKWNYMFEYKDGELYWKNPTGNRVKKGDRAGTSTPNKSCGYHRIKHNNKYIPIHRIVYEMHYGDVPEGLVIDHINRNKTDNRIENLRAVTTQENNRNVDVRNSTNVRNVYWHTANKKYNVQLSVNGKQKHFGSYDDLELAEFVAQEARELYYA